MPAYSIIRSGSITRPFAVELQRRAAGQEGRRVSAVAFAEGIHAVDAVRQAI